ncbi:MAG: calcium-binding protein [Cyanobacteria bacterium J06592_8]
MGTNRFLVLGAYSGQNLESDSGADYRYGTNFGDVISGYRLSNDSGTEPDPSSVDNDQLRGFDGDDIFYGGAGADIIKGDAGSDTSSYIHSTAGITVDLANKIGSYAQVANDGFGGQDKLYSIENIIGSDYGDNIKGDDQANVLNGGQGTDTLKGGTGADTFVVQVTEGDIIKDFDVSEDKLMIQGMGQYDRRDYEYNSSEQELSLFSWGRPVAVLENIPENQVNNVVNNIKADMKHNKDAPLESVTGGWAKHDGIFIKTGSSGNDSLTGVNGQGNIIAGHGGNDTITGGDSGEWMWGGSGDDSLIGGSLYDQMFGGDGNDSLYGNDHVDRLYGNAGNDYLNGGNGGDFFILNSDIGIDTIADFNANEGDKFLIDKNVYGISDLNDISYNSNSGNLSANGNLIAVLNSPVGFAVNDTNISLRENLLVD